MRRFGSRRFARLLKEAILAQRTLSKSIRDISAALSFDYVEESSLEALIAEYGDSEKVNLSDLAEQILRIPSEIDCYNAE